MKEIILLLLLVVCGCDNNKSSLYYKPEVRFYEDNRVYGTIGQLKYWDMESKIIAMKIALIDLEIKESK